MSYLFNKYLDMITVVDVLMENKSVMAEDENYIHFFRAYNVPQTVGGKKTSHIWGCSGGQRLTFHRGRFHTLKHYTTMGTLSESSKNNVLLEHKGRD